MVLRKNLNSLILQWKLYPSRTGVLHEVSKIETKGSFLLLMTNCGFMVRVRDSKYGRAARWLRNVWLGEACLKCKIFRETMRKYSDAHQSIRERRK